MLTTKMCKMVDDKGGIVMKKFKKIIAFCLSFALTLILLPVDNAFAAASAAPAKPTVTHNQWGTDVDGNYDITSSIWYGNNATSYKVFERFGTSGEFELIDEGKLEDGTPAAQSVVTEVRDRSKSGIYYYYTEFINEFGSSKSDIIEVVVGTNGKAAIVIDKIDNEGVKTQFTIEQGTVEYKLTNPKSDNSTFEVISNTRDVAKTEVINGNVLKVTGLKEGRSGLKITDKNTGDIRHIGVRVKKANGDLPGMPNYLSIGQVSEDREGDLEFWRSTSNDYTNKRTDVRYIYINGGPFTGWRHWTTEDGARAKTFIDESLKMGMIPFFVYYNIPDDGESYELDLKHINDKEYMEGYFKDLKFFLDICKQYGGDETIGMIFEPDFLGYMMQQADKAPNEITALVDAAYSSGVLEKGKDPEFENNVKGLVESINYTVDKYYKEAYFGWQFNIWSYSSPEIPNQGLLHKTEFLGWDAGREFIKQVAVETANYYESAGIKSYGADFISVDKYGLDGAFETGAANDPEKSKWFWNADIWDNYLMYVQTLSEEVELPSILWQIPVGHINGSTEISPYDNEPFAELTNEAGSYEDSATSYFFGDTFKAGNDNRLKYFSKNESNDPKIKVQGDTITWESHISDAMEAGITSILFGAGVGASTDAVGSPPTDDYFWITKAQHYYDDVVMLDGSNNGNNVDKPLKPGIKASAIESDGNYDITVEIPENSKGESYKLFENGKLVKKGAITSLAEMIKYEVINKPTGTYMYKAEIFNSKASNSSEIITVKVNNNVVPPVEVPLKPELTVDNTANAGDYTLSISIPKNSNATSYNLRENNKIIKTGKVDNNAQSFEEKITGKESGEYIYKLDLINKDGTTSSDEIKVVVKNDAKPETGVKVAFNITSTWGSESNYELVITNNTGADINNWELNFKSDIQIKSNWDANLTSENGVYKLTPKSWNGLIKKGEKLVIGGACATSDSLADIYDVNFVIK